jgi:hypothetical protein
MKVTIEYWSPKNETIVTESGFRYLNTNSVIQKLEEWEGSEEEIFKKFYKQNNSLRYCNGSHYKFEDKNLETKYQDWYKSLDKNIQFSMYYGNGVVD